MDCVGGGGHVRVPGVPVVGFGCGAGVWFAEFVAEADGGEGGPFLGGLDKSR